jgi:phosphatidylserine synthase
MATSFGNVIGGTIERLVRWIVVPVTGVIPGLVSSGALFVVYGAIWLALGFGLATDRTAVDQAWRTLTGLPLPVQAVVWLLFLPLTAGLWVWGTDWPEPVRLAVVLGLGAWNLLVFLPHRAPTPNAAA